MTPDRPDQVRPAVRADEAAGGGLRAALLAAQPGRRREAVLVDHLVAVAAEVLDVAPAAIDRTAPLSTLGLESAGMVELRTRLEVSLGTDLPATVGWRYPTLAALAPYLAERMGVPLTAAPTVAAPGVGRATVTSAAAGVPVHELTDEELGALLDARLDHLDRTRTEQR